MALESYGEETWLEHIEDMSLGLKYLSTPG